MIFYDDPLLFNFKANIVSIIEKNELFYVILDRTAFYFGGGGQPCDTGTIDGLRVTKVFMQDEEIVHVLMQQPQRHLNLECTVDSQNRLDFMQQHLAQHIISGAFYNLYSKNTFGIHLGEQFSTVDINGEINKDEVLNVERLANKIVQDNIAVESFEPEPWELNNLELRRALPDVDKKIRILKIGDFDINACCGVHFKNTINVVFIKIKRFERNKGNTRIEFVAGARATDYILLRDYYFEEICKKFNTNEHNALNAINNLKEKVSEYAEDNKNFNQKYISYKFGEILKNFDVIKNINVYKYVFDEKMMLIKKISEKIIAVDERNVCIFASRDEDQINFLFACSTKSNLDMAIILRQVMQKINGKGGGTQSFAQGFAKSVDADYAIDFAVETIRRYL